MPSLFSRNKNKGSNSNLGVGNSFNHKVGNSNSPNSAATYDGRFPSSSLSPNNHLNLTRTISASSSDARPLPDLPRGGLGLAASETGGGDLSIDGKGPTTLVLPTSDSNGSGLGGSYHHVSQTEMMRTGSNGPTDYSVESSFYSNSDNGVTGGAASSSDSEFGRIRNPTRYQSQSLGYSNPNGGGGGYDPQANGKSPIANDYSYNSPTLNKDLNLFPNSSSRSNHQRGVTSASTTNLSSKNNRSNTITRRQKSGNALRVNASLHPNGNGLGSAKLSPLSSAGFDLDQSENQGYLYGYTNIGLEAQLEVEMVEEIVRVCGDQIRNRGLDSPLIFSSMALDLSPSNTTSLIRTLLTGSPSGMATTPTRSLGSSTLTLPLPNDTSLPASFLHEIRFANPHDLSAVIKWAMARMGHVLEVPVPAPKYSDNKKGGDVVEETAFIQQRGFIEIEAYLAWREGEKRQHYPEHAFSVFLSALPNNKATLVSTLFSLLSSTTSYSLKNGMTPSKLSRIFGVLVFGLPEDETFARTYDAYLKASNAMEHLLLASIRDQSTSSPLPTRLLEQIEGYPNMLSGDLSLPSSNAKSVPITQIEKSVRLYSSDLIQDACELDLNPGTCPEWEAARGDYNTGNLEDDLRGKEIHGMDPQLSDRFRKLVNLRGGKKQGRDSKGKSWNKDRKEDLNSQDEGLEAYGSLASKEWGDFMSSGFSAPDESKLAFDLRETERKARNKKRETVQWSQFEELGFKASQEHDGLDKVLAFDDGLKEDMSKWPEERAELLAKLRAQTKKLPPFPYDTTPRVIASPTMAGNPSGLHPVGSITPVSRMDDTFPEVFADYLVGNGWSNRDELTHRAANFVVVQYKSRPTPSTVGSQAAGASSRAPTSVSVPRRTEFGETIKADSRVDASWFVISEIVPQQYRDDLEAAGRPKRKSTAMLRKFNVFSKKSKNRSNALENWEDPDDVFRPGRGGTTKVLKFNDPAQARYTPVTDLHHSGTVSSYTSTAPAASLHTSASIKTFRPQNERANSFTSESRQPLDDTQLRASAESTRSNSGFNAGNTGSGGAGSRMFNALRAKSKRAPRRKDDPSEDAPPPPPKGYANDSVSGGLGVSGMGAREDSFSSADFETKSLHDKEEDEFAAKEAGTRKKRNPLARHSHRESKDDSWIDVMMKANSSRMTGQDAQPSTNQAGELSASKTERSTPTPTGQVSSGNDYLSADSGEGERSLSKLNRTSPRMDDDISDGSPLPAEFAESSSIRNRPDSGLIPSSSELTYLSEKERETPNTTLGSISGVGNSSLDSNAPASNGVASHPRDMSGSSTLSVPALDAGEGTSSSSGGSLKSRKSIPEEETKIVKEKTDSASLARSLREKLSPVEGSPLKKKEIKLETSPTSKIPKPKLDPFAKDRTQGRVASIANNFGGPGKAGSLAPLSPQGTGGSFKAIGKPLSPVGPNVGGGTTSPIPPRSQSLPTSEEPLIPTPAAATIPSSRDSPATGSTALPPLFPSTARPASSDYSPSMPPSPRSVQGGYPETIYPDDAASNYSRDTHSTDENEPNRSSTYSHPSQSRPISGISDTGFSEEGGYRYRADEGRTEEEDEATAMHVPVTPYTPGLPLENVMEESESVLSGSNNG